MGSSLSSPSSFIVSILTFTIVIAALAINNNCLISQEKHALAVAAPASAPADPNWPSDWAPVRPEQKRAAEAALLRRYAVPDDPITAATISRATVEQQASSRSRGNFKTRAGSNLAKQQHQQRGHGIGAARDSVHAERLDRMRTQSDVHKQYTSMQYAITAKALATASNNASVSNNTNTNTNTTTGGDGTNSNSTVIVIPPKPCIYRNGTAPEAGSCTGPMQRTLARRDAIYDLNRGCGIDQVFFTNARTGQVQCGQCIPGTHGNWRITGVAPPYSRLLAVQQCSRDRWAGGFKCDSASASVMRPTFFCGLNEYCNDDGKCISMTESPLLNQPCSLIPYNESSLSRGYKNLCEVHGLTCIAGKCQICANDVDRLPLQQRYYNAIPGLRHTRRINMNSVKNSQLTYTESVTRQLKLYSAMCTNDPNGQQHYTLSKWEAWLSGFKGAGIIRGIGHFHAGGGGGAGAAGDSVTMDPSASGISTFWVMLFIGCVVALGLVKVLVSTCQRCYILSALKRDARERALDKQEEEEMQRARKKNMHIMEARSKYYHYYSSEVEEPTRRPGLTRKNRRGRGRRSGGGGSSDNNSRQTRRRRPPRHDGRTSSNKYKMIRTAEEEQYNNSRYY